jgi:TonB-dependent starch-binding outer membrane protein SusC
MKLTTLMFVIALMHTNAKGYGQITLKEKNAPLEKILTAIEKQTKYVFLYDPEELKTVTITVNVKNATLKETLDKCFKGSPIEYTIIGNNVLLKKTHSENVNTSGTGDICFKLKI